jgi:hypothetical protein
MSYNKEAKEMDEVLERIRKALADLGIKGEPKIQPTDKHRDRWRVEVNGKYIGIYDLHKNTFVD